MDIRLRRYCLRGSVAALACFAAWACVIPPATELNGLYLGTVDAGFKPVRADGGTRDASTPAPDAGVIIVPDPPDSGPAVQVDAGPTRFFFDGGGGVTFLKSQVTYTDKRFGWSVAIDADGSTLAVGALFDASGSRVINGDQFGTSAYASGAVFVFERVDGGWTQAAYLKASNADFGDWLGFSVAISDDGNTIVAGAPFEASSSTGVNGAPLDNSVFRAGAAYVFHRSGGSWVQAAYLKPLTPASPLDQFGWSVAINATGNVIAVGAPQEDSASVGVDGGVDETAPESGAVTLYYRVGSQWFSDATLKPGTPRPGAQFGTALSLNATGTCLIVGAPLEAGTASGVDGDQTLSGPASGAAYVFLGSDAGWSQSAYLKAAVPGAGDQFGFSVALDATGDVAAVGAPGERGASSGFDGDQTDDSALNAGAVYLFEKTPAWAQRHYIKAQPSEIEALFGHRVVLQRSATALVVSAPTNSVRPGAVFVLERTGGLWRQTSGPLLAPYGDPGDRFGWALTASPVSRWLAAGAIEESSSASGINGEITNNDAPRSGAAYVFPW